MQKLNNIPFKLPIVSYNGSGSNSNSSSSLITVFDDTETVTSKTLTSSQTFVIIQTDCQVVDITLASFSSYGNATLIFINNNSSPIAPNVYLKTSQPNNFFGISTDTAFDLGPEQIATFSISFDKITGNYYCFQLN